MTRHATVLAVRHGPASVTALTIMTFTTMMMLAVLQHAAAQPRLPDDTVVHTAAPGSQATVPPDIQPNPQDSFRQRVRDEMADWRSKMRSFDDKVDTGGRRHADAAETRLRAAWDDTEVEARTVQTASARDWVRTKRAYEEASHRMAMAWDKIRL